jgi:tetratricopeptide (TPR) repeat protein
MKSSMTALGLALAIGVGCAAAPASAQYAQPPANPAPNTAAQQPPAEAAGPKITPSRGAHKAILELQQAVLANDAANVPAKLAAAEAAAKTDEDRYLIAGLRLKAAVAAKDESAKTAAIEALLASGKLSLTQVVTAHIDLGVAAYNSKQFDKAAAAFERAIASNPNNSEAVGLLAQTRQAQGRPQEAVGLIKRAISQSSASGQRPKEDLYKKAVSLAYGAKLPEAIELSRSWVVAYPTSENWRDAIGIYRNLQHPPEDVLVDLLRLARATGSLQGKGDYHAYAFVAIQERAPAEAKAVVEEGIAAQRVSANEKLFRDILAEATAKSAGQTERLPELIKDALAAPTANLAVNAGNILYGNGDYAKAAELYRAALGKTGANKSLVNLRLGMALARAGDKAGATTALNSVTGQRAEVAKYWLAYLQTRA